MNTYFIKNPFRNMIRFFLIFLLLHTFLYLIGGRVVSFSELWFLLQNFGLIMLFYSDRPSLVPEVYKSDGKEYIFYNNRYVRFFRYGLFLFSIIILGYAKYIKYTNNNINISIFSILADNILLLVIIFATIKMLIIIKHNRKDCININENNIQWSDNDSGDYKIEIESIQMIEIYEVENKFEIQTSDGKYTIELLTMSISSCRDKIEEVLKKYVDISKVSKKQNKEIDS